MRGTRSFLIKAKLPLAELIRSVDKFYRYLEKDLIITAQISDRHGLEFGTIFDQIKESYMISVKKTLPQISVELGFDHYWTFEEYSGCVVTLSEILEEIGLVKANTESHVLNYLIQTNFEV